VWDDENGTTFIVGSHAWKIEKMIMGFQLDFSTGELIGDIHDLWPGEGGIVSLQPFVYPHIILSKTIGTRGTAPVLERRRPLVFDNCGRYSEISSQIWRNH